MVITYKLGAEEADGQDVNAENGPKQQQQHRDSKDVKGQSKTIGSMAQTHRKS